MDMVEGSEESPVVIKLDDDRAFALVVVMGRAELEGYFENIEEEALLNEEYESGG